MSIKNLTCECCLGALKQINDKTYKCEFCDKEYIDHVASEEEMIWVANANQTLRKGNFDDAYEEFSSIVEKYPSCYEAYYGMCLCTHGVLFVDDILENKKVPTCYNISISSFLEDENFKKTIQYCPDELKNNFLEQARKIEVIRKEWLDKASKEDPYDIFISFKQSDREKGLEKTPDFYSAKDIYNYLTYNCGLKVFFSPETLKNKLSEQYEPYIYNALNTAKIMIVYAENPAYLSTTWVKNEWIRFLRKIKNKEKEPNSLVVVYKNFDAYELPKELRNMQALKSESMGFTETLINHINKVFESDQSKQKIERKEIKVGQIATRSRTIGTNQIVKRELGSGVVITKDASIARVLDSLPNLISHGRFDMAKAQLLDILSKEPNNSKALYLMFLIENNIKGADELKDILTTGSKRIDIDSLDKLISSTDKNTAMEIISIIKEALINKIRKNYVPSKGFIPSKFEDDILAMYNVLSGYDYEGSDALNKMVLDASAKDDAYLKLFNHALRTLDEDQVDEYIEYHISFVKNIENDNKIDRKYIKEQTGSELSSIKDIVSFILERALKVDEGNSFILEELYALTYDIKYLEASLSYAKDKAESKKLLIRYIKRHSENLNSPYDEILKYIPSNDTKLYQTALQKRYDVLKKAINASVANKERHLSQAKYYLEQLILENGELPERMFELFKYNLGCVTEKDLIEHPVKLDTLEAFNKVYYTVDPKTQNVLLEILDKQEARFKQKEEEKRQRERDMKERERRERERRHREEEERKKNTLARKELEKDERKKRNLKNTSITFIVFAFMISFVNCGLSIEMGELNPPMFVVILVFLAISIFTAIGYTSTETFSNLTTYIILCGILVVGFNCGVCIGFEYYSVLLIPVIALLIRMLYVKTK